MDHSDPGAAIVVAAQEHTPGGSDVGLAVGGLQFSARHGKAAYASDGADPSGREGKIGPMLLAKIDCSDPECEGDLEIVIEDLGELGGLTCECGHGFVLTSVSELRPDDAKVVSIQFRQGRALRKLAA